MRYFAILKDSIREALDAKILYVMIVLSTCVILIVLTLSFKPLSAHKTMEQFFPNPNLQGLSLMFLALNNQELRRVNIEKDDMLHRDQHVDDVLQRMFMLNDYRLEKVELLRGEADAPESEYLLTITDLFRRIDKKDDLQTVLTAGSQRVRKIFQKAEELGLLQIGEIHGETGELPDEKVVAGRVRYLVTLHGTPQTFRIWANEPSILFGMLPIELLSAPLGYQLYVTTRAVMLFGAWIAILVGVVITSFFIPNMLSKGTIDMLLVKPINRWTLLLYKYIGGLTFIFLNALYAIGGMWLVVGLRTGIWNNGSLLLILTLTFFFAILYAISTLVAIITRSTIASIVLTLIAWVFFFGAGASHEKYDELRRREQLMEKRGQGIPKEKRWGDSSSAKVAHVMYMITPRTEDLNELNDLIVYCDFMTGNLAYMARLDTSERDWWECVLVSTGWIVITLMIACLWFTYKDY